jgi:hypothetical protein
MIASPTCSTPGTGATAAGRRLERCELPSSQRGGLEPAIAIPVEWLRSPRSLATKGSKQMKTNRFMPEASVIPVIAYADMEIAADWLVRALASTFAFVSAATGCSFTGWVDRSCSADRRRMPRPTAPATSAIWCVSSDRQPRSVCPVARRDDRASSDTFSLRGAEYGAIDPLGVHWYFSETIEDVAPQSRCGEPGEARVDPVAEQVLSGCLASVAGGGNRQERAGAIGNRRRDHRDRNLVHCYRCCDPLSVPLLGHVPADMQVAPFERYARSSTIRPELCAAGQVR